MSALKGEVSLDYFWGLLFGHFPYYSPEVYRANVHDFRGQASANITATLNFEFMEFAKFIVEMELVPALLGLGTSMYTTSALGENCFWMHLDFQGMVLRTRTTKNIKRCGRNIRDTILEEETWEDIGAALEHFNFLEIDCEYTEEGSNREQWDFLAFPTIDFRYNFANICLGDINILDQLLLSEDAEPEDEDFDKY